MMILRRSTIMTWFQLICSLILTLGFSLPSFADPARKLLLLSQGPDGHPPQTHEYRAGLQILATCLQDVPGLAVTIVDASEPWTEGPQTLAAADGVVLFLAEGAKWVNQDPKRYEALSTLAARRGGLVA